MESELCGFSHSGWHSICVFQVARNRLGHRSLLYMGIVSRYGRFYAVDANLSYLNSSHTTYLGEFFRPLEPPTFFDTRYINPRLNLLCRARYVFRFWLNNDKPLVSVDCLVHTQRLFRHRIQMTRNLRTSRMASR